ncbi:telomere-associated protein RIF1-like isoform X1 [Diabrotica virgifera virgifera]|uniref:Telomere-associated protein RIF1-like n=1 Tax=Diabrotica virgifera virgifera TaxID=50390 RepID=A0ABM5JLV3_DIAVI|nr:telomere-associated protein RIF1-like isoform X1 [Diabrotica virgifera virgifera]
MFRYIPTISQLRDSNYQNWHKLWIFLVRFCAKKIHQSMDLTNRLLRIVEYAFRTSSHEQRLRGYDCWKELIDNASLDPHHISSAKQIKLLVTPLKAKFSKQEVVISKRFDVFVHLLQKLKGESVLCLSEFLEFCFGVNTTDKDNHRSGQAKTVPMIWPKSTKVLLSILGHSHEENTECVEQIFKNPILTQENFKNHYIVIINSVGECCGLLKDSNFDFNKDQVIRCMWKSLFNFILSASESDKIIYNNMIINILDGYIKLSKDSKDSSYYKSLITLIFTSLMEFNKDMLHDSISQLLKQLVTIFFEANIESDEAQNYFKQLLAHSFSTVILEEKKIKMIETLLDCLVSLPIEECNSTNFSKIWTLVAHELTTDFSVERLTQFTKFKEFFLWPSHYLHYVDLQEKKQITINWMKLYRKLTFESDVKKVEIIKDLEKDFKNNPLLSSNITSLLNVISQFETKFGKEFVTKLMDVVSLVLQLPNLNSEDQQKLSSLVMQYFESSLECFTSEHNEELIKFLCNCIEHILRIHSDFKLLDPFVAFYKNCTANLQTQFAFHLKNVLVELLDKEIDANSYASKEMSKCLVLFTDGVKDKDKEEEKKTFIIPTGRSARIARMGKDSPRSPRKAGTLRLFGKDIETMSPHKLKGSQLNNSPVSSKKNAVNVVKVNQTGTKPISEENSQDFVPITSEVKLQVNKLNDHQKEKLKTRRDDIPALYQDLSQSLSQDIFSSKSNSRETTKSSECESEEKKDNGNPVSLTSIPETLNSESDMFPDTPKVVFNDINIENNVDTEINEPETTVIPLDQNIPNSNFETITKETISNDLFKSDSTEDIKKSTESDIIESDCKESIPTEDIKKSSQTDIIESDCKADDEDVQGIQHFKGYSRKKSHGNSDNALEKRKRSELERLRMDIVGAEKFLESPRRTREKKPKKNVCDTENKVNKSVKISEKLQEKEKGAEMSENTKEKDNSVKMLENMEEKEKSNSISEVIQEINKDKAVQLPEKKPEKKRGRSFKMSKTTEAKDVDQSNKIFDNKEEKKNSISVNIAENTEEMKISLKISENTAENEKDKAAKMSENLKDKKKHKVTKQMLENTNEKKKDISMSENVEENTKDKSPKSPDNMEETKKDEYGKISENTEEKTKDKSAKMSERKQEKRKDKSPKTPDNTEEKKKDKHARMSEYIEEKIQDKYVETPENPQNTVISPKRSVGRPRRNPLPLQPEEKIISPVAAVPNSVPNETPEKKRRGRPKKSPEEKTRTAKIFEKLESPTRSIERLAKKRQEAMKKTDKTPEGENKACKFESSHIKNLFRKLSEQYSGKEFEKTNESVNKTPEKTLGITQETEGRGQKRKAPTDDENDDIIESSQESFAEIVPLLNSSKKKPIRLSITKSGSHLECKVNISDNNTPNTSNLVTDADTVHSNAIKIPDKAEDEGVKDINTTQDTTLTQNSSRDSTQTEDTVSKVSVMTDSTITQTAREDPVEALIESPEPPQKPKLSESELIMCQMDTMSVCGSKETITDNKEMQDRLASPVSLNSVEDILASSQTPESGTPLSTPQKSQKIPTSPVTAETPNRTNELLDNTINISPITSRSNSEEEISVEVPIAKPLEFLEVLEDEIKTLEQEEMNNASEEIDDDIEGVDISGKFANELPKDDTFTDENSSDDFDPADASSEAEMTPLETSESKDNEEIVQFNSAPETELNEEPPIQNGQVSTTINITSNKTFKGPTAIQEKASKIQHIFHTFMSQKHMLKRKIGSTSSPSTLRIKRLMNNVGQKQNVPEVTETFNEEDILTFSREIPSPLAVPRSSILKRKFTDSSDTENSPCPKRKRVNFSDPCLTSKKLYIKDEFQPSLEAKRLFDVTPDKKFPDEVLKDLFGFSDDTPSSELSTETESDCPDTEPSLSVVNPMVLQKNKPIFPKLLDCKDDVLIIVKRITSPMFVPALMNKLKSRNVETIGDLAKLSESEVNRIPFKVPVVANVIKALENYYRKKGDGEKLEEKLNNCREGEGKNEDEEVPKLDIKLELKMLINRAIREKVPAEELSSIVLSNIDPSKLTSIVKSYNPAIALDALEEKDFSAVLKVIINSKGISDILKRTHGTLFNDEREHEFYEAIAEYVKYTMPLEKFFKGRSIEDLEVGVEESIKNKTFHKSDVIQHCLMPLIEGPKDLFPYLENLSQIDFDEIVMNRLDNENLQTFFERILTAKSADSLKKITENVWLKQASTSSEIVSCFKNKINSQNDNDKKDILVEMFKFCSENIDSNTLLELHVSFLRRISVQLTEEK